VRELMDVTLKGKVDERAFVVDARLLHHATHAFGTDACDQLLFEVGVAKMEKMARVVPDEAVLPDGAAIAADVVQSFADELVLLLEVLRESQPGYAGAKDEKACLLHRMRRREPAHSSHNLVTTTNGNGRVCARMRRSGSRADAAGAS
jgi:hypothetical protein